jgi:EmrB/QacA subfamily drug resistance transporter
VSAAVPPTGEEARQHHNITLAVLLTGALAYALSQTMIAPALPAIQDELSASTTTVTFALTGYLLTASIATPIVGRLGDMFGKERMLVITLIVFGLGSLVSAVSHSIALLILGRAIQGMGGAVFPLSFGIIRDEFPREKVATGIGLISATFGIGGGAGLVLSGLIVDHLAYEWIFWLALIAVIPAVIATHLFVPRSPVTSPAKIDYVGAALLGSGLASLLIAVSEGDRWGWTSAAFLGLIALALVLIVSWARFELRHPEPLVDMRMMQRRPVFTTNLAAFLIGFGMFGSYILIPQFVQVPAEAGFGFGSSVTGAGLFMLPSAFVMLFAGPISGWMGSRAGSKLPLLIGTVLAAASFALLAAWHDSRLPIYLGTTLMGLGIGFAFAAMANLIVEAVDQSQTGVATGMNTIMRTIGGAIGGQVSASVIAGHVAASGLPEESGYTLAFTISAVGVCLAAVATLAIPGKLSARRSPAGSAAPALES